jgi:hypothetical protein
MNNGDKSSVSVLLMVEGRHPRILIAAVV